MMLQKVLIGIEEVHGNPFHINRHLRMQKVYQKKKKKREQQKKHIKPETLSQNITTFIFKQLKK